MARTPMPWLPRAFAAIMLSLSCVRIRVCPWVVRAVAGVTAGVLLAGCATPDLPFVTKSADQLAAGAVNALGRTPVLHVSGTLQGDKPYRVDVTGRSGGTAQGSGTYDGHAFSYRDVGGRQYLKGEAFWQGLYTDQAMRRQARGYQDNWVVAAESPVTTLLGLLVSPITLAPTLGAHAHQLSKAQEVVTPAGRAVALKDRGITYYVTTSDPVRLVRVRTDPGYKEPSGLSDVRLDIAYPGGMPPVPAPTHAVDPADPATLPALYEAQSVKDVQPCDATSCTFQITLLDKGGAPVGTTTVTFHMLSTDAGRKEIGSCSAQVPVAAHGQQVTAACAITGPGWSDYIRGDHDSYYAEYTYQNPPYDS
jgi:hypothetical protein